MAEMQTWRPCTTSQVLLETLGLAWQSTRSSTQGRATVGLRQPWCWRRTYFQDAGLQASPHVLQRRPALSRPALQQPPRILASWQWARRRGLCSSSGARTWPKTSLGRRPWGPRMATSPSHQCTSWSRRTEQSCLPAPRIPFAPGPCWAPAARRVKRSGSSMWTAREALLPIALVFSRPSMPCSWRGEMQSSPTTPWRATCRPCRWRATRLSWSSSSPTSLP
mmetsp:Transcript_81091/g.146365  ORF Transcript_81091/g.146365 Transcript_81091/m.146365 type:complete len:222 (+) Transcript_81091:361-1026(+)